MGALALHALVSAGVDLYQEPGSLVTSEEAMDEASVPFLDPR
jgi:hypothetical protein